MTGYILSVISAAVLAAVLRALAGEGTMGKLTKLLSGLFLAVTVLSPLVHLEIPDPARWLEDYMDDGEIAAQSGEAMAKEYSRSIISAEVEAYILDKAAALDCMLEAEVRLDDNGLPEAVTLTGQISPADRAELSRMMARDLGIGEEAVTWTD